MRVAIYNPGPSMPRMAPACDYFIGVNRAANAHRCDAWACGDLPAVVKWADLTIGSPTLLTAANTVVDLRQRGFAWRGKVVEFDALNDVLDPAAINWHFLTALAAVVYAASLGATTIDVYGADWSGTADWDGVQAGQNRSPDRWAKERELFDAIAAEFLERGITVERNVPHKFGTFKLPREHSLKELPRFDQPAELSNDRPRLHQPR